MEWSDYEAAFRVAALAASKPQNYIEACLKYAERLHSANLPIIYDEDHLAQLVGYQPAYLFGAAYCTSRYYRTFSIPKKSGGNRDIQEPLPSLKEIQRWILDEILYRVPIHSHAKGFVPGRSIKDNARFHQRQLHVLSIDMKDFFPSIDRQRVYSLFRSFGYCQPVSNLLGRLCTLNDALPQGAPSSPAITNLICRNLDRRVAGFAKRRSLRYTRYADDISISGEFRPGEILRFLRRVITEEKLELHPEKVRLLGKHQRQQVTGIVVNKKMQAPRHVRRKLRQEIYYIKRYGLDGHLLRINEKRRGYVWHLLGLANFVRFVNPKDRDALEAFALLGSHSSSADEIE